MVKVKHEQTDTQRKKSQGIHSGKNFVSFSDRLRGQIIAKRLEMISAAVNFERTEKGLRKWEISLFADICLK